MKKENRQNTSNYIDIMKAHLQGEQVQRRSCDWPMYREWVDVTNPQWVWERNEYRIKPEDKDKYSQKIRHTALCTLYSYAHKISGGDATYIKDLHKCLDYLLSDDVIMHETLHVIVTKMTEKSNG